MDRNDKRMAAIVEKMKDSPEYWQGRSYATLGIDLFPVLETIINKINSSSANLLNGIAAIPDAEIEKIVCKQERRLRALIHFMEYGLLSTRAMAESGYRDEVMKVRKSITDNVKVNELFAQGLTAYEIMESGGPITNILLERWLDEQESEVESEVNIPLILTAEDVNEYMCAEHMPALAEYARKPATLFAALSGRGEAMIKTFTATVKATKPDTWCTCNNMGTCLGCMIEKKVKECYGTQGLAFLLAHVVKAGDTNAFR